MEEYRSEQVAKSFSSSLSSSLKTPEGWTDGMTSFVQESNPDSEDL